MNGDGRDDILVGAQEVAGDRGQAYVTPGFHLCTRSPFKCSNCEIVTLTPYLHKNQCFDQCPTHTYLATPNTCQGITSELVPELENLCPFSCSESLSYSQYSRFILKATETYYKRINLESTTFTPLSLFFLFLLSPSKNFLFILS